MKKKNIKTTIQTSKATPNKMTDESTKQTTKKVTVGEDEFCPTCMEWRPFDEISGKCSVCGRLIKKTVKARTISEEFDLKDFTIEHDESSETNDY